MKKEDRPQLVKFAKVACGQTGEACKLINVLELSTRAQLTNELTLIKRITMHNAQRLK